ncbi:MAG: DUF2271 domain-containing protein [Actinomycetota bacterium]
MMTTTLGAGVAVVAGSACGTSDATVLADQVATSVATTTTTSPPTTAASSSTTASSTPTSTSADGSATTTPAGDAAVVGSAAVVGEMVIAFTYTWGPEGKIEPPYVAVWIEDEGGALLETIALFYEQGRRGARWLDHLDRWFTVDASRIAAGGVDDAATISSATREPGAYTVAWDGLADGVTVPAGRYHLCIEAVREDGPLSLIREPFDLAGTLAETSLPDVGELSMASVRIDG